MITTKLKEKVIEEATKLKKCATNKELNMLNFYKLRPDEKTDCIYGQMTGHCFSDRAVILLQCCAYPYSKNIDKYERTRVKVFKSEDRDYSHRWLFSPIEFYIAQNGSKNNILIDFLKGEKESLTVDEL